MITISADIILWFKHLDCFFFFILMTLYFTLGLG